MVSCTDGLNDEARSYFLNRNIAIGNKIKYFQDQIVALNQEWLNLNNSRNTLPPHVYHQQHGMLSQAISENNTNIASEQKKKKKKKKKKNF